MALPSPRFSSPPQAVRRVRSDNLALVPASLLPYKDEYQAIANQQPPGTTLVVLPIDDSLPRRILELVASRLKAKGQRIQLLPSNVVTCLH